MGGSGGRSRGCQIKTEVLSLSAQVDRSVMMRQTDDDDGRQVSEFH